MKRRRGSRHRSGAAIAIATALTVAGCGDSGSTTPTPIAIPSFLMVGNDGDFAQIYRVRDGAEVKLSSVDANDVDPRGAAGRIVFTSDREGNSEVYMADSLMTVSERVTNNSAQDAHPALDPTGATIVFVSDRSGAPRLWMIPAPALDAPGFGTAVALETGSATSAPETAPAWSPNGATIAFSSTRTGRSEIFTVPAAGGTAVQLTNEIGGAFNPAWSADGSAIYYTSTIGTLHLRRVPVAGGSATDFATDSVDLDAASCNTTVCITAENPAGSSGSVVAYPTKGGNSVVVIPRTRNEREVSIEVQ